MLAGLSPAAAEKWRELAPEHPKSGLLTLIDGDHFGAYCESLAEWQAAEKLIRKHGRLLRTVAGLKVNPAIRMKNDALKNLAKFGGVQEAVGSEMLDQE